MMRFLKNALTDIRSNRFLNIITIMTIALSMLLISVFMLFLKTPAGSFPPGTRVDEPWFT